MRVKSAIVLVLAAAATVWLVSCRGGQEGQQAPAAAPQSGLVVHENMLDSNASRGFGYTSRGGVFYDDGEDGDIQARTENFFRKLSKKEELLVVERSVGADNDDPRVEAFRAAFVAAHPGIEPDAFTALGYDTAKLLMLMVDAAAVSADPVAVRDAFDGLREFEGVTGRFRYTEGGHVPVKSVSLMEVDAGQLRFVAEILPTEVPAP